MPHGTSRDRGFTLVELIAAVVILGVAIPPMLWALGEAQASRVTPFQASRARWLATAALEDVIADRHSGSRGFGYLAAANYPDEPSVAEAPSYWRRIDINETGADLTSPGAGYKTVTVTVGWTDARGRARSVAISTVVTEYPSP